MPTEWSDERNLTAGIDIRIITKKNAYLCSWQVYETDDKIMFNAFLRNMKIFSISWWFSFHFFVLQNLDIRLDDLTAFRTINIYKLWTIWYRRFHMKRTCWQTRNYWIENMRVKWKMFIYTEYHELVWVLTKNNFHISAHEMILFKS